MKTVIIIAVTFIFFLLIQSSVVSQTSISPTNLRGEVAITFDDGPNPKTTKEIVDILKQFHVPATFFVVGENVECYPSLVTMIVRSGSEVGDHTWSHPQCRYLSLEAFEKEVETTRLEIKEVTGNFPKLFRFPYGEGTKKERLIIRSKEGMVSVLWDVDPRDWQNPSSEKIINYVLSRVHAGSIILLHEGEENTIKALPFILADLEKRGLLPVTLSHLLYDKRHPTKS